MRLIKVKGHQPKHISLKREKNIYRLLSKTQNLLEKGTQFKYLSLNKGPEKGPDFIAVNKRGNLILGEIKKGAMRIDAWRQVKKYAKLFWQMREDKLNAEIGSSLKKKLGGFLSKSAWAALLNPSRRKLQLVLLAESFSDKVLRYVNKNNIKPKLRRKVKDVKCIELGVYKLRGPAIIATASVISGRRRKLRR